MVCDSMHMVPPNVLLPPPPQELQDWQRRRRLGLVDVPARSPVGESPVGASPVGDSPVAASPVVKSPVEGGDPVPLLEPATPGHGGLTTAGGARAEAEQAEVLGYPLVAGVMINGMGLVVGRYGRILRTTDGGITWTKIDSPTTAHLHGLSFNHENTHSGEDYDSVEENTGWAVGDRGTILQTDDRGLTWREITNDVLKEMKEGGGAGGGANF